MRKLGGLLVVGAFLVVCWPATGQQPASPAQAASFWSGVNPRNITSTSLPVVNPTKAMKNYNLSKNLHPPAKPSVFNVSKVFPKISLGSWPPIIPNVGVLPQAQNPFQPTPPKGVNLFNPSPKK